MDCNRAEVQGAELACQEANFLHCYILISHVAYGFGATVATDATNLTVTLALVLYALQYQVANFVTISPLLPGRSEVRYMV